MFCLKIGGVKCASQYNVLMEVVVDGLVVCDRTHFLSEILQSIHC